MQWFGEFSDIGSEILSHSNLTLAKASSVHCHSSQQDSSEIGTHHACGAAPSQYQAKFAEGEKHLEHIDKLSFDIWQISGQITGEFTLPLMTLKCVNDLGLNEMISNKQFGSFLDKVNHTYKHCVQYHNNLHGADVMQFAFY